VLTRSSSWRPQQLRTTTRCADPRIHVSIPSFAYTQGIMYLPDTTSRGSPSPLLLISAPSRPCLPGNGALARHSINVHRTALLHRSCTPLFTLLTNMPSFPEFTAQILLSLPGCRWTSIRPRLCTRRSSRLRSSNTGCCEERVVTGDGEGVRYAKGRRTIQ